jgi:hypothetical protein
MFHRLPQTLDAHIIPPGSAPVHAEVTPPILDRVHERLRGELAALIGIHNLWCAMPYERLVQHRNGMEVSNVIATVEAKTLRLAQSTTAVR